MPAQAGIHFCAQCKAIENLDSGLRRNDQSQISSNKLWALYRCREIASNRHTRMCLSEASTGLAWIAANDMRE